MALGYKYKKIFVYFSISGTYRPLTKLPVIRWGHLTKLSAKKDRQYIDKVQLFEKNG
jgi:hypothetical protein